MQELANNLSFDKFMEEVNHSIYVVKLYKQHLRKLLKEIKLRYSEEEFFHSFYNNSEILDVITSLNCSIKFKLGRPTITIVSNIDPQVTVSTKLLSDKNDIYFNYYIKNKKRSVMLDVENTQSKT